MLPFVQVTRPLFDIDHFRDIGSHWCTDRCYYTFGPCFASWGRAGQRLQGRQVRPSEIGFFSWSLISRIKWCDQLFITQPDIYGWRRLARQFLERKAAVTFGFKEHEVALHFFDVVVRGNVSLWQRYRQIRQTAQGRRAGGKPAELKGLRRPA